MTKIFPSTGVVHVRIRDICSGVMDSGTNKVECDSLGAVVPLRICETEDDGVRSRPKGSGPQK